MRSSIVKYFLIFLISILSSCSSTDFTPDKIENLPTKQSIKSMERATPPSLEWREYSFYVKIHIFSLWGYGGSCTGNVISTSDSTTTVLTAAHCLYGQDKYLMLIERYDGKYFLSNDFITHPDYRNNRINDVGLIFLKENIGVKPIPISLNIVEPGEAVRLGGFQASIDSNLEFRKGDLSVFNIDKSAIYTRYSGVKKDFYPCFGNSGGGVLKLNVTKNREYKIAGIVGIVSRGNRTCHSPGSIGVHARISKHIKFIIKYVPNITLNFW